ncbi:hypothetical protein PRVXT_002156 [Proteinivorax tanatarense]|uniref:Uncharacterized protein n=1 Tax=Proteinivorax tanatarense TaxID=1260629 RepID=A0AAU7VJR4_9FIRM
MRTSASSSIKSLAKFLNYACFSCGYGSECSVGGFVELFPQGTKITKEITPTAENQHPEIKVCKERTIIPKAQQLGFKLASLI